MERELAPHALRATRRAAKLPLVGRSSIWGVESDSGEEYFAQLEEEQIADALADVERLRVALCLNWTPRKAISDEDQANAR